jgi:hypothetical protein
MRFYFNLSIKEIITVITIVIICSGLLRYFTQIHNISVCVDCQSYIEAARSITQGNGYRNCNGDFINHYPPLYSYQLAGLSIITNQSAENIGLVFNCLWLGIFIFFSFLILKILTKNYWVSLIGLIVLLTSPFIFLFNSYLSEVPFLGMMMIYFFLSIRNSTMKYEYIWIGTLVGLMALTRFAGVVLLGISLLQIITKPSKLKEKSLSALMLVLPFLAIILAWKVYSIQLQSNELTSRSLIFHAISKTHWHEFYLSIKSLLFNNTVSFISLSVLVLFSFVILVRNFTKRKFISISNYQFLVLSAFSYLAFIIFAISFFDFAISLDTRILAPFSILTIIALVSIIYKCLKQYNTLLIPAFMLLSLIYVAGNIKKSYIFWEKYRQEGDGFNSSKNEAIAFPPILNSTNKYIYSDKYTFIKYRFPQLCENILPLPLEYIEINNSINPEFKKELVHLIQLIEKDSAMIIMINSNNPLEKKRNQNIIQIATSNKNLTLHSTEQITWIE